METIPSAIPTPAPAPSFGIPPVEILLGCGFLLLVLLALILSIAGIVAVTRSKGALWGMGFGIAGVVATLVGVLSIGQGFRRAMIATGSPDTALVLRSGADSEMMSILPGDETRIAP